LAVLLGNNPAPGGPGTNPQWSRADKDGVGTAISTASNVWFTLAGGVVTEAYYPDVDTPQIRDLQFLVTDGATFFHDPKVDFQQQTDFIDPDALGYRITSMANGQPYRLVQEIISEPEASCLLIRVKLEGLPALPPNLRVYLLLAPHLEGFGAGNKGQVARTAQGDMLVAHRGNTWLAVGADCGFKMTGCGYVGVNDGWQDIIGHRRLPIWTYNAALNGNIALTAEINLAGRSEFVLALAFGEGDDQTPNAALGGVSEALSYPFEAPAGIYSHLSEFLKGWKNKKAGRFVPGAHATFDGGRLFNISRNVLLAHEDKTFAGALVASMSIPWGEASGDQDGGYHLVWPRDMCQSALALLATGEIDLPLRGLIYLAAAQNPDGSFYQNFYINGKPHSTANQLDEFSFPVILAYRLTHAGALQGFDPRPMVLAAAGALIANGPMTQEERWEENEGYSPSTLAANIAGLVCAAYFADLNPQDHATAQFLLEYADFLESHLEAWTVTTQGNLLPGVPRHYIRFLPTYVKSGGYRNPSAPEDPNSAMITIGNRGNLTVPARNVVDAGFLELVRYGIRRAGDPLMEDTLRVVDASIKDDLPGGPCWRRYTEDGYGQAADGGPFLSVGLGRPWPLLTGERAHYEYAAGRNVAQYTQAMENFAGQRGLLAEQLWNRPNLASSPPLVFGGPTGSAMPLAWAQGEYIKLVRTISDGRVFDLIQIVADRYLIPHGPSLLEVWNFDRQLPAMARGKSLRFPLSHSFQVRWSADGWASYKDLTSTATAVGIHYADIPTDPATPSPLSFTFFWTEVGQWEGRNYQVNLF
jgi:glucoamylase